MEKKMYCISLPRQMALCFISEGLVKQMSPRLTSHFTYAYSCIAIVMAAVSSVYAYKRCFCAGQTSQTQTGVSAASVLSSCDQDVQSFFGDGTLYSSTHFPSNSVYYAVTTGSNDDVGIAMVVFGSSNSDCSYAVLDLGDLFQSAETSFAQLCQWANIAA